MTDHSFSLIPFPDQNIPKIKITGNISRQPHLLVVHYSLSGKIEDILFPKASSQPSRREELWRETCFEFFLAIPGQPQYWEFNLSPSGDWNIFRMDSYRRVGFREEKAIEELMFEVRRDADCFSINASVNIDPIVSSKVLIQTGITTVIQTKDGHESYWALSHPKLQADFHLRESFILTLEGSARL